MHTEMFYLVPHISGHSVVKQICIYCIYSYHWFLKRNKVIPLFWHAQILHRPQQIRVILWNLKVLFKPSTLLLHCVTWFPWRFYHIKCCCNPSTLILTYKAHSKKRPHFFCMHFVIWQKLHTVWPCVDLNSVDNEWLEELKTSGKCCGSVSVRQLAFIQSVAWS